MSTIRCPKCASHNLYQERDRSFEPDPWILGCHTCGYRIYGEKTIRNLIQRQAPHLAKAYSAHVAARKAEVRESFRQAPTRPPAETNAPRRGRVLVHCALCGKGVWRRPYDIRSSPNKRFFCCLEHLTEYKRKEADSQKSRRRSLRTSESGQRPQKRTGRRGAVEVHCAVCNAGVWRRPWDVKTCKSGLFFCSGEHRLQWLRSGKPLVAKKPAEPAKGTVPVQVSSADGTQNLPATPIETPSAATISKIYANNEAAKGTSRHS